MCVLSIKVPIRKKSGNLSNAPCIYIYIHNIDVVVSQNDNKPTNPCGIVKYGWDILGNDASTPKPCLNHELSTDEGLVGQQLLHIYICVCVCVCVCGELLFVNIYLIKQCRHFYLYKLPYRYYDIRRELVYKLSIINWFSSIFGLIIIWRCVYRKSDITFACTTL